MNQYVSKWMVTSTFYANGRQPQHFRQKEDNFIFFNKKDLNFLLNERKSHL